MNDINTWAQGSFIDMKQYAHMSDDWKARKRVEESFLVRPGPTDNAICRTDRPEDAVWIASRLNLASDLERLAYDFATGKSDGQDLVTYVRRKVDAM